MLKNGLKLPLLALVLVLVAPGIAFANTRLYSQELGGFTEDQFLGGTSGYPAQQFTATNSGTVASIAVAVSGAQCSGYAVWDGSTRIDGGNTWTVTTIQGGSRAVPNWTWTMTSGHTYKMVCGNNASTVSMTGTNANLGGNYAGHSNLGTTFNANPTGGFSLLHWQYAICSDATCSLGSAETGFRTIYSPPANTTTPTPTVNFKYDYFYNDVTSTFDFAGTDIKDITIGSQLVPVEEAIISSGGSTYNENITLTARHEYLWRPYLRNSPTGEFLYGDYQIFFTVSNPYPQDFTQVSTSTASSTQAVLPFFSNLYNTVKTSPPFGFIFETIAALNTLSTTSTATTTLWIPDQIRNAIFNPLDIAFASLIGLFFGVWLFKRASHIQL